ncbi:MAG: AAA family ATPase [Myxococcales bacterium]|nr:AAA family ATPase [Myxococcales bacterium]
MTAPAALTAQTAPTTLAALQDLRVDLDRAFIERSREVTCLLVALLAGEHVLLLGPPGTAKSALTNALTAALGGTPWSLLFTKFTVPEEVFGPISLQGLEQDQYRRVTAGYLPEATVAFADEIFKANSAILNGLLTAINERQFDNGGQRISIPLEMMVGASNELPEDESLGALFDRFVLRRWVGYISDRDKLRGLLSSSDEPKITASLTIEQVNDLRTQTAAVNVDAVIDAVLDLREKLAMDHEIVVSDRRWCKAIKLIKGHALLNGRAVATREDLDILSDCLWDEPDQRASVDAAITKLIDPDISKARKALDLATAEYRKVDFAAKGQAFLLAATGAADMLEAYSDQIGLLNQTSRVLECSQKIDAMRERIALELKSRLRF